jgi:hypothetical protein
MRGYRYHHAYHRAYHLLGLQRFSIYNMELGNEGGELAYAATWLERLSNYLALPTKKMASTNKFLSNCGCRL